MDELDKKIQNMDLIIAMRKMQDRDTQENRNNLINQMMRSKFITPALVSEKEAMRVSEASKEGKRVPMQVNFKVVTAKDGKKFLPAFTDTMLFDKWQEKCGDSDECKKMVMNFDVYAQYILNSNGALSGFIINPFSENLVFPEPIIRSLAKQKAEFLRQKAQRNKSEAEALEKCVSEQ
ncbi:MAG: SseB family protein [Lachnospiraceae bacterium]|nr:SseB family protein [Candidatus Merdinaster equi]